MYRSITYGWLTLDEVFEKIKEYIMSEPDSEYHVMIGCDSQQHGDSLKLVSAIIVHRIGKGCIFFTEITTVKKRDISLREKIYDEASRSLEVAVQFKDKIISGENFPVDVVIHLDIGKTGKTSMLIKELVRYIESCGFEACIKDTSRLMDKGYEYPVAASSVADRYSK